MPKWPEMAYPDKKASNAKPGTLNRIWAGLRGRLVAMRGARGEGALTPGEGALTPGKGAPTPGQGSADSRTRER